MSLTATPAASSARSTSVARPSAAVTGTSMSRPVPFGMKVPVANGARALAATAPSAPSASVSRIRWPPTEALSSAGVPSAITVPPSMTAIRLASWSASSRYCVVSSSVVPSATSSRTMSHMSARALGSRPVVGSSRNRTAGWPIRLAARSRRRRMPPEYVLTALAAASVRPKRASSSSARRLAAPGVRRLSWPIMIRLDRPVRYSSSAAYWPVSPMVRRTVAASACTSWPRTRACPRPASAGSPARGPRWSFPRRSGRAARRR